MYISLRIKVWVLLLILIAILGGVFYAATSGLILDQSLETFQVRILGVAKGASAYWDREKNQLIRTAKLYAESEKIVNYSVYGLHNLLQRDLKRLLTNSGYHELEVYLKSGTNISGNRPEIEQSSALNSTNPRLKLANLRINNRNRVMEVRAEVPLNKMGEFVGRLTLVKRWDDQFIREMGGVLQAHLAVCSHGEVLAATLKEDERQDLLVEIYRYGEKIPRFFDLILRNSVHSFAVIDLGEAQDRETVRLFCALSQRKTMRMVEEAKNQALHLTLIALTISLFFAFLFAERVLTRRIRAIRDGAMQFAQEQLSFRLPESWSDEVGDLASSFNDMAARLQENHQNLVLKNEELQLYVHSLENLKTYIQNVLGSLGTGVLTWGKDGRVTTMNPAAERELAELSEVGNKLSLRRFVKRMHKPSQGIFMKALRGLVRQNLEGIPFDLEFDMSGHRGFKVLQGSLTFLRDAQKQPYGMVLTLENITQRKIIEQQLYHSDKLSSIGQLAASVAHEIKNPLASIKTLGQLLQEETPASDGKREYIDVIVSEVNRLNGVVEQLLKFAKPEESMFAVVKVGEILKPVLALVHHEMIRHQVKLVADFDESLEMLADAEKVKQVFLNLIFNAIQAMPEGGTLKFRIFREGDSPWTIIAVEDSGIGMNSDIQSRVFEPFFTTKQRGTGLGLAIVKKIVDLHGGKIEISSQIGQGTTVTVFLPNERKELV